jgi:hypothetical protein
VSISHRNSKDKAATRRISAITIGVRHRRDLGGIDGLAASIAEIGLLHPVVTTPRNVGTGSGELPTPVRGRGARGQS